MADREINPDCAVLQRWPALPVPFGKPAPREARGPRGIGGVVRRPSEVRLNSQTCWRWGHAGTFRLSQQDRTYHPLLLPALNTERACTKELQCPYDGCWKTLGSNSSALMPFGSTSGSLKHDLARQIANAHLGTSILMADFPDGSLIGRFYSLLSALGNFPVTG